MTPKEEERVSQIEELVAKLESVPDLESRKIAISLMEAILRLYGSGIERIMDIVFESGEAGEKTIRRLAKDELVASLLILHGLHPDDFETRAHQAVNKLNGKAEMLGVFEGVVRVRVTGGHGLKDLAEKALRDALPDAAGVIVEESEPINGFVPISAIGMAVPERV
jgi:hypothetical protein